MPSKCRPDAEAFADRVYGRTEIMLRGGFVGDYHRRSVSIVARFEGASGKQRNLERAKIIARDGGERATSPINRRLRALVRRCPTFAHAISNTNPTAPRSARRDGFISR